MVGESSRVALSPGSFAPPADERRVTEWSADEIAPFLAPGEEGISEDELMRRVLAHDAAGRPAPYPFFCDAQEWADLQAVWASDAEAAQAGKPLRFSAVGTAEVRDYGPHLLPDGIDHLWPPQALLASTAAGSTLAALLECVDLPSQTDEGVLDTVESWTRLAAWAQRGAAAAAGHLAGRESMQRRGDVGRRSAVDRSAAGTEVALRLGWSTRMGARLVRDGAVMDQALNLVGAALERGEIDYSKARPLLDRLHDLPADLALAVQERVLPDAPMRTPVELARDVERALLVLDPQGCAERAAKARTLRRVNTPRLLPDGMSGLWAVLPAHSAAFIDATLDASARAARAEGDPRTLSQLRADVFASVFTAAADDAGPTTHVPSEDADPPVRVRRPRIQINVTAALSTLLGLDDAPCRLDGHGPLSAEQARALALEGPWRRILVDPLDNTVLDVGRTRYRPPAAMAEHVRARDAECVWPGCVVPAERVDLDHTVAAQRGGPTSAANLGPLCRFHHGLKSDGSYGLEQERPGVFVLTTPTGQRLRTVPGLDGRTERLPRAGAGPGGVRVVGPVPRMLASAQEATGPPSF